MLLPHRRTALVMATGALSRQGRQAVLARQRRRAFERSRARYGPRSKLAQRSRGFYLTPSCLITISEIFHGSRSVAPTWTICFASIIVRGSTRSTRESERRAHLYASSMVALASRGPFLSGHSISVYFSDRRFISARNTAYAYRLFPTQSVCRLRHLSGVDA